MSEQTIMAFPVAVSMIGGARSARIGARFVWIEMPDCSVVRVKRSAIPEASLGNAFRLADIAHDQRKAA